MPYEHYPVLEIGNLRRTNGGSVAYTRARKSSNQCNVHLIKLKIGLTLFRIYEILEVFRIGNG